MRTLLLLRGSPGCGKSTWIEQNGLKPYTLSADDIRLLCSSPALNTDGLEEINQKNDEIVWATLFQLLETRMVNGEFTVIDATNSKTSEMNRYKTLCEQYRYRIWLVDFTDVPIEVAKERNRSRVPLKRVSDTVIDKMYARFATQKVPSGITVIKPDELDRVWIKPIDLTERFQIRVLGDIHGCMAPLNDAVESARFWSLGQPYYIILTGDYIDRGIQNAEVVQWLIDNKDCDNILMLEGNHERYLWAWANGRTTDSREFETNTRPQLEAAGIDKKEVRKLCRRFAQCAYFKLGDNTYLITHGGLSTIPDNLTFVATSQMIHGVGSYVEAQKVDDTFLATTPDHTYQIHGHRNVQNLPTQVNDRCFNLEGGVEMGGCLRGVTMFPEGVPQTWDIENTVYRKQSVSDNAGNESVADAIISMRKNKYIEEKQFGNISSFNFTRSAFYDKVWNSQTIRARGMYINIPERRVVARAYDKFFNIGERPETRLDVLRNTLTFPVTAYVKENGFLGIVSYNDENDSLFVTTKSCPDGIYAGWLRDMLYSKLSPEALDDMKRCAKESCVSFVFECVDMVHDPHIIEYPESQLVLLDVVKNSLDLNKLDYVMMHSYADCLDIPRKERARVIGSWQEFCDWYNEVMDEDYLYKDFSGDKRHIEGFVLEDANGYMLKLKLPYYNTWKFLRGIAHETLRKGYIEPKRTALLTTPLANYFYGWLKDLYGRSKTENQTIPTDICSLRRMFFNSDTGKEFDE